MTYDYCDKLLKSINRKNLRLFDKLRLMKFDELNVGKTVKNVFEESEKMARKMFLAIAKDAYHNAMREAGKKPSDDITEDWVLDMLEDYDPVTLYLFLPEVDRKKERLTEALLSAHDKGAEVDKALRLWTLQISHYAERCVNDGTLDGFRKAGVKKVRWRTAKDERVCHECHERDGVVYDIDKIPDRPHYHCRCWWEIVE